MHETTSRQRRGTPRCVMKRNHADIETDGDDTQPSITSHHNQQSPSTFREERTHIPSTTASSSSGSGTTRKKCPYLDTVDRQHLDFDMEKVCSVTLSNMNIYACLVCGKFFQGRGQTTPGII